ncbi:MAG: MFS transporter, partial [Miltoncostaeaceae bacterium]
MLWCALLETVPLYPFYALLFAEDGLSERQITALFALWSLVSVVAEVPCGALADRVSRRAALAGAGALQAAAYSAWMLAPGMAGFAAGFALWGLSGALAGGAFPALVHDALRAAGAERRLGRVLARAEAAAWAVQVPLAGLATLLFALGGYTAVGAASIATGLAAAATALGLPRARAATADPDDEDDPEGLGYLALLRAGAREAATSAVVRGPLAAVAALAMLDAVEEYTPLLASDWGVGTVAVPAVLLAIPLAGAAGAVAGGRLERGRPIVTAALAPAGAALFAGAVALGAPAGMLAVAAYFGLGKAL